MYDTEAILGRQDQFRQSMERPSLRPVIFPAHSSQPTLDQPDWIAIISFHPKPATDNIRLSTNMKINQQIIPVIFTPPGITYLFGELMFRLFGRRSTYMNDASPQVRRILVSRLDKIGDVVLTSGFLRELRRNYPSARITLLVNPDVHNLVSECPYVDELLTFNWKALSGKSMLQQLWGTFWYARRHLWKRRFELAIAPRWDVDFYHENYLVYFSGAPKRIGYTEQTTPTKSFRNHSENILFTRIIGNTNLAHEQTHNLDVLRFLGHDVQDENVELWTKEQDHRAVENFLREHQVCPDDALLAIGPGAGHPRRIWPLFRFIEVGRWLQDNVQGRLLVLGGPDEQEIGDMFRTQVGHTVINAAGNLSLTQSTALLQRCRFFLGNDSGLMHLAAAAGIPVAEISCHPRTGDPAHYNSPVRFGPWGVPSMIMQPASAAVPCTAGCEAETAHCILGISTDTVIRQLKAWIPQLSVQEKGLLKDK